MKTQTRTFIWPLFLSLLLTCGLAAAEVQPELRELRFTANSPGSEKVVLQLNGSYSPKVFTMKDETPRIVLDFKEMTHSGKVNPITVVNGAMVQRIRVGMHTGGAPKTRVVLDLATFAGVSFDQHFDPAASTLTIEVTGMGAPPPTRIAATGKEPALVSKVAATPTTKEAAAAASSGPALGTATAHKSTTPPVDSTKQTETGGVSAAVGTQTGAPAAPAATTSEAAVKPIDTTPPTQDKPLQDEPKSQDASAVATGQPTVAATAADGIVSPVETSTSHDKPSQPAAAPPPQPAAGDKVPASAGPIGPILESVTFDGKSPKGEMVLFKLSDFHPPEVHGVEEGIPRVICDFKDTRLADSAQNLIKTDGQNVKIIRISKTRNPEKVRVVLDLVPNRSYDLQQVFFKEDNLFVIIVNTVKK